MDVQSSPVLVVLSGIGGYGGFYLEELFHLQERGFVSIAGVVEPAPQHSPHIARIKSYNIPVFDHLREFYANHASDLAVIASPLQFHAEQTQLALQNGSHVLCDKPLCTVVQDGHSVIRIRDENNRLVLVGYQWSYSQAIQALKSDLSAGVWGAPLRIKTICLWPRGKTYYSRNKWAGRIQTADGRWVLDSPAHNAMAHFLHNLLYLCGGDVDRSAEPAAVTGEIYKANPIENFDSVACRIKLKNQTECFFLASHAVESDAGPFFHLECEEADIHYEGPGTGIYAEDKKGKIKLYGDPDAECQFTKLTHAVEAVYANRGVVCGPEAALPQVVCVNGLQDGFPQIPVISSEYIETVRDRELLFVPGLKETMLRCYRDWVLPHSTGAAWSRKGHTVSLAGYDFFPRMPQEKESRHE